MEEQTPLDGQPRDSRVIAQGNRELLQRLRGKLDETTTSLGVTLEALEESVTDRHEISRRHGEDLVALRFVGDRHAAEISETRAARHDVGASLTELEQAVRERRVATERLSDRLAKSHRTLSDYRWQTQPLEVSQARAHELVHRLWVSKMWRGYRKIKNLFRTTLPTLHNSLAGNASESQSPEPPPDPSPERSGRPAPSRNGMQRRFIEWWERRTAMGRAKSRARRAEESADDGECAPGTVQTPIDRDRLLDLLERDKVIVTLKKVIAERERRIEVLEQQLAVVSGKGDPDRLTLVAEAAPAPVDPGSSAAVPDATDGFVAVHGAYDDGWLSTDALFRAGPALRGKTLRLGLWLPRTYRGVQQKGIRFEIDGGASTHVEVTRDREFLVELPIPAGDGDLGIRITADTLESPRLRDIRQLGVRLTRWESVEPSAD